MPAAEAGPATPSRHSSGSSTNPNTPRPTTPDQPVIAQAQAEIQAEEPSLSTSSSSDDRADIQTTRPQSIDVTKSAAVAVWGNDHRLSELFLDIHWHLKSNKAFFKLRATVALASQQKKGRRDGRTSVYLFIHPERICQLSLDDDSSKRSNEKKMLGAEMLALRFELNRPPAMILPRKESECEPKNKTSAEVLDALRDLACQTHFTICARIPRRRVSMARMQELCAEASEPGRLMSLEAHATLARLYQGQGGILVEGDTLPGYQAVDVLDDDGPPPEYGEPSSSKRPSEEPPPALFSDGKGKKRRRASLTPSPEHPTEKEKAPDLQTAMRACLVALKKHVDEQLAAHKEEVASMLVQAEARILSTLRTEMNQQCDSMHDSVEERVQREIGELEEEMMRRISEAPLQARLTFPDHPWY